MKPLIAIVAVCAALFAVEAQAGNHCRVQSFSTVQTFATPVFVQSVPVQTVFVQQAPVVVQQQVVRQRVVNQRTVVRTRTVIR